MYKDISIEDFTERLNELPDPTGYRLLVAVPEWVEKTRGGILLPDNTRDLEKTASILGLVLKIGPDAYVDSNKFPSGPWCSIGDWVLIRSYSGTRFRVADREYRIINDDTVEATVGHPNAVERA